jgi:hypothetical protein
VHDRKSLIDGMLVLNWLTFADLLRHDLGLRRTPPKTRFRDRRGSPGESPLTLTAGRLVLIHLVYHNKISLVYHDCGQLRSI